MGSYSNMTISDYPIFDVKNGYYEDLVKILFLPDDFIMKKESNSTRNKLVWGDQFDNEKGNYTFKGFRQTVKNCKDRLEIYGASILNAKKDFNEAKKISKQEEFYSFSLNEVTYDEYLVEICKIIESKEKKYDEFNTDFKQSLISGDLGIYGQSTIYQIYSILSVLPATSIVEYDLTEIINGGWVKKNEVVKIEFEKIIVLTEGKTDVEFISLSLQKLFPHLKEYYHFINFDEYKVESNASALVKLMISLAAAKVKHPIIALFDNDTTGLMEMKKLNSLKLPSNFRVLKYPDIILAKKYPTIGPTGIKKMNINGLACGIEMYFGIDILTKESELIPIHWKAFNEKEKKYQGEISEKNYVQEEFRKKIKANEYKELPEMKSLLHHMFNAYK
jgi:hypothetical protein